MRAVFDTCILVDYLRGLESAREALDRVDEPWISILTWMEILSNTNDKEEREVLREFLESFRVHPLTQEIAAEAVRVRSSSSADLPEAIVLATARLLDCELITWYPGTATTTTGRHQPTRKR